MDRNKHHGADQAQVSGAQVLGAQVLGAQVLGARTVWAAALLCLGLGSVHGFSVFLAPLEAQFGVGRGAVSLTYSLALVAITLSVLAGPLVYGRAPAWVLFAASGVAAALGAGVAGLASSGAGAQPLAQSAATFGAQNGALSGGLWQVWLGFGVIFGAANGLGYGFGLQLAGQAWPGREGVAMGIVTAAYAAGAAVSPMLFQAGLAWGGFAAAMGLLAAGLLGLSLGAAVMVRGVTYRVPDPGARGGAGDSTLPVPAVWLAYGAGVAAGLMAIGHAAGIAATRLPGLSVWIAPAILALCNLGGSILGGRLADRWRARRVLVVLPVLSALALAVLALRGGGWVVLPGLALVGFAYGGTIAAYPAVIAKRVGPAGSAAVYGRVFTAWGAAGLAAPWVAGVIFDKTGGYGAALGLAAAVAVLSAVLARRIF